MSAAPEKYETVRKRKKLASEWVEFGIKCSDSNFRKAFLQVCWIRIFTELKRFPVFGDEHITDRKKAGCLRWQVRNREKHLSRMRERAKERRRSGQDAAYMKRRLQDPVQRIKWINRSRIHSALHRQSASKMVRSIMGCDAQTLRAHLESLFKPGMHWGNQGKKHGTWQLDHKRPLASYDLTVKEQQAEAFHYTNLQPMWFHENSSKRAHWNGRSWRHADHKKAALN